jgi:hypothetical protein
MIVFTEDLLIKPGAVLTPGLLSRSEMLVLKGSKKQCLLFSITHNKKAEGLGVMTYTTSSVQHKTDHFFLAVCRDGDSNEMTIKLIHTLQSCF